MVWNKGKKGYRNKGSFPKGILSTPKPFLKGHIPWNKGKKRPEMSGEKHHFFGKHHTKESKKKISKAHKGQEMTKKWAENISEGIVKAYDKKGRKQYTRYYHFCNSPQYRKWRLAVYTRDNFTCVNCRKVGGYLVAHHIKGWAEYPKLRYLVDNGITLCLDCHKLTDNFQGRGKS